MAGTSAVDYFAFVGLPRKLNLDVAALERRFRALSRQFHPDYFCNASAAERRASLEHSSYLNDAYRTLQQPAARIAYLLEIEGAGSGAERPNAAGGRVPAALLEEVFALNEQLEEARDMRERGAPREAWLECLRRARRPIEEKRLEHERQLQELSARWDALVDEDSEAGRREVLSALGERMLERNYINNLLATIDREAAGAGIAS
jgi:molecular chaperone HscB